ncbi:hypothetical protein QC760_004010 [Botrytis cinerea]
MSTLGNFILWLGQAFALIQLIDREMERSLPLTTHENGGFFFCHCTSDVRIASPVQRTVVLIVKKRHGLRKDDVGVCVGKWDRINHKNVLWTKTWYRDPIPTSATTMSSLCYHDHLLPLGSHVLSASTAAN